MMITMNMMMVMIVMVMMMIMIMLDDDNNDNVNDIDDHEHDPDILSKHIAYSLSYNILKLGRKLLNNNRDTGQNTLSCRFMF